MLKREEHVLAVVDDLVEAHDVRVLQLFEQLDLAQGGYWKAPFYSVGQVSAARAAVSNLLESVKAAGPAVTRPVHHSISTHADLLQPLELVECIAAGLYLCAVFCHSRLGLLQLLKTEVPLRIHFIHFSSKLAWQLVR